MSQKQNQRKTAVSRAADRATNAVESMGTSNMQQQVAQLRQTLEDEANDDRPRLWVLPGDVPSHDETEVMKEKIQEVCPDYLVRLAVNTTDGGVDEENIHAALFGATTDDLEDGEGDADEGHWRFCDGIADPRAPAGSGGKLALEQHTETGEYRTRPYGEVVDAYQ